MATSRRLKLLFITQEYSDESAGGAGVYAYELCKALAESGQVEVHALVPGKQNARRQVQDGLILHERKTIFKPLLQVPSFYLQVWRSARGIIKREGIQLIHTNENAGVTVLGQRPNVATIHHPIRAEGGFTTLWQRLIIQPDIFMEKIIMRRAGHVMVPSHLARDLLVQFMPALKQKITIVPNGLDPRSFKPQDSAKQLRRKLGVPEKSVMIFFPGALRAKRKGALDFIAALQQLQNTPDYRVVISGKNREMGWSAELRQAMEACGLADRFIDVGEINYQQLPQYYAGADFVVYPSTFEGYGLPVIETMASANAVIATKTGEAPYIIEPGKNGLLVDVGDVKQLAQAIDQLLRSPGRRTELGAAAIKTVGQTFAWQAIVTGMIAIYKRAQEQQA